MKVYRVHKYSSNPMRNSQYLHNYAIYTENFVTICLFYLKITATCI